MRKQQATVVSQILAGTVRAEVVPFPSQLFLLSSGGGGCCCISLFPRCPCYVLENSC